MDFAKEFKALEVYYHIKDWKHGRAILCQDFPAELADILGALSNFRTSCSEILAPGGGKSTISSRIDGFLYSRGWQERKFETKIVVDDEEHHAPTHKIDCFRNGVGVEVEWNNKTEFYDRDLNNFRLLFELRALSVGVVITRSDDFDPIFRKLGKYSSYGRSTTVLSKLLKKIEGGGSGGCPLMVFGMKATLIEDAPKCN